MRAPSTPRPPLPPQICEHLLDECLRRGSTDNISAILIILDPALRPAHPPPAARTPARPGPSLTYPFTPRARTAPGSDPHPPNGRGYSFPASVAASLRPRAWMMPPALAAAAVAAAAVLSAPVTALCAAPSPCPAFASVALQPSITTTPPLPPSAAARSALRRRLCSPACFLLLFCVCTLLATVQMVRPPPPTRPLATAAYTSVQASSVAAAAPAPHAEPNDAAADTDGGAGGTLRPGGAAADAAGTAGKSIADSWTLSQRAQRGGRRWRAAGGRRGAGRKHPAAEATGVMDAGTGGQVQPPAHRDARGAAVNEAATNDAAVNDAARSDPRGDATRTPPPGDHGLPGAVGASLDIEAEAGALVGGGGAGGRRQGADGDELGGGGIRRRGKPDHRGGVAERVRPHKPKHIGL